MPDYIPAPDAEFNAWQENFVIYLNANFAALGLVAADVTPITTAQNGWLPGYTDHLAAQNAAQGARATKDGLRAAYVTVVRALVKRLQASPAVSDAERAGLGINIPAAAGPIGPPASRPLCTVDCSQRLRHIVGFMDESTPTKKAKPEGVLGAEIWVKVGSPAPVDPSELVFLALDTRTPYTADYAGADGNKVAHYMLRWVNPTGQKGPWSETVSATIGA